jgi:anaerobic selenocysteine-containing dehydrogenase
MPDIAETGCLILWGYNPSFSRITHATAAVSGLKRGMKLIVVDPRNVGLANKADVWLRVRPGTDGALALGLANIMIKRGWYDQEFVRTWSNGPLLVRSDTNRLLKAEEVTPNGGDQPFAAWDAMSDCIVRYDPAVGRYEAPNEHLTLHGDYAITTPNGVVWCRPVFDRYAELCSRFPPEVIEATCWIPREQLENAAYTIWHARPVSYYAWSGHEHHANTTETARAIAMLYALTGSFDAPGGNVLLPAVQTRSITGEDLPAAKQLAPAIGYAERPLGTARWNSVSTHDFYRAVLEGIPYPVRVTLEQLSAKPGGLRKPLTTTHMKYAALDGRGNPRGFQTPSRKVEFWSETFLDHGHSALPELVEPPISPSAHPELNERFPLILTCAKPSLFCQSQHRALPSLRKRALYPEIELHPATATARGIQNGDWVEVYTLTGAMRAKARFSEQLDPRVVVGEHGWWQGCEDLDVGYSDPFDPNGTNFNLTVSSAVRDPISGTPSHRSNLCEIRLAQRNCAQRSRGSGRAAAVPSRVP